MTTPNKFHTRYDPAPKCGIGFEKPSMTQQQFARDADINNLIDRYNKTGSFYNPLSPQVGTRRQPMFDDFTNLPDVGEAFNVIADAQERFEQLPSKIRAAFDNNPTMLLAFIGDPNNRHLAEEMGLLPKLEAKASEPLAVASPAVETATAKSNSLDKTEGVK